MKEITVALERNPYTIHIGRDQLSDLGMVLKRMKMPADALVISSDVIWQLHGKKLKSALSGAGFRVKDFLVPDGERSKSARCAFRLMEDIARYDVYKNPFIVAFGGGVIGDLAGYVAAAYKRGISYIQVPTTLLAQVDSAIGGKVAVDLPVGKNLVGAFHQPRLVWSDISLLDTLPLRQMRNGFAEVIKYGIIYDESFFAYLEDHLSRGLEGDGETLERVVNRCSAIKADVVMKDERETKNIRTILNFGHTLGHALEAAGKFRLYQHGEAIGLGMRMAADISFQLKMLGAEDVARINHLLTVAGLPDSVKSRIQLDDVLTLMRHDKKFIEGKNRFVLARRVGEVEVCDGIPMPVIRKACRAFMA